MKVGEKVNPDAAWFYPEPKEAAKSIKNYVAFWRGVKVSEIGIPSMKVLQLASCMAENTEAFCRAIAEIFEIGSRDPDRICDRNSLARARAFIRLR